ncbi:hypothetical protein VIBNISOn1_p0177 [Vibrio nigripulchritudo SOn1]|uniref:Uncharacterized protein n=1 Tax=Vibrio nigripulchritudo SOn1 TaxID=1238450 RepID=A0AAV2W0I5_9VIBR|nr:hypothetical protein VIBNISOn1_p0177 [Vibrio nigripulchritudo SOn1]
MSPFCRDLLWIPSQYRMCVGIMSVHLFANVNNFGMTRRGETAPSCDKPISIKTMACCVVGISDSVCRC